MRIIFQKPNLNLNVLIKFLKKYKNINADVNFPWQLSRGYFLVKFAQAYHMNKDQSSYEKFKYIISDWIDKNKFLYGINWFCGMEVGLRSINWIASINLFS